MSNDDETRYGVLAGGGVDNLRQRLFEFIERWGARADRSSAFSDIHLMLKELKEEMRHE